MDIIEMLNDKVTTTGILAGHDGTRVFIQVGGTTDTIWFNHYHVNPKALDMYLGLPCEVTTNTATGHNTLMVDPV